MSDGHEWSDSFEKDFMDKLYDCYDREIKNLWQRSIFLGVFLLAVFTGYGAAWKLMLEEKVNIYCHVLCVKIGLVGLSLLGFVFSVFWVMMAKGSKGLQELYEGKIRIFDKAFGIETDVLRSANVPDNQSLLENRGSDACVLSALKYGSKDILWIEKPDHKLLSQQAGAFSVSKINILLGQVFMIFWTINNVICVQYAISFLFPYFVLCCLMGCVSVLGIAINITVLVLIACVIKKLGKSGLLEGKA